MYAACLLHKHGQGVNKMCQVSCSAIWYLPSCTECIALVVQVADTCSGAVLLIDPTEDINVASARYAHIFTILQAREDSFAPALHSTRHLNKASNTGTETDSAGNVIAVLRAAAAQSSTETAR